jgi:hypothetical protein
LFDALSLNRPEARRAEKRLLENIFKKRAKRYAVLVPYTMKVNLEKIEKDLLKASLSEYDLLLYGSPYGLIPFQIKYVYPFSQTVFPQDLVLEERVIDIVVQQIENAGYKELIVVEARSPYLREAINRIIQKLHDKDVKINLTSLK